LKYQRLCGIFQGNSIFCFLTLFADNRPDQPIHPEPLGKERDEYGKRILSPPATKLNWLHYIELLSLKADAAIVTGLSSEEANEDVNEEVNATELAVFGTIKEDKDLICRVGSDKAGYREIK
jgi:hypothetical protein